MKKFIRVTGKAVKDEREFDRRKNDRLFLIFITVTHALTLFLGYAIGVLPL